MAPARDASRLHPYRREGGTSSNVWSMLDSREAGQHNPFGLRSKGLIGQRFIPNTMVDSIRFDYQVFCGQFSSDGEVYMSACQDQRIRLYRTEALKRQTPFKVVEARDIGYSIIDVDFSPDQRMLIYSSWSNYVHMCNVFGDVERHEPLDFRPVRNRICFFSVKFSPDSREIIGGCSDHSIYVYDIEAQKPVMVVPAHDHDVNSVCFADESPFIIYSASDDCLCKVWDMRVMRRGEMNPVGALVGHTEGLTHVSSKGDGRFLVTNSKDQTAKLWDIRLMTKENEIPHRAERHRHQQWDYRWEESPRRSTRSGLLTTTNIKTPVSQPDKTPERNGDKSVWTFQGHSVLQTLIRCYFSPIATTAQRYVYVGSATRTSVHVYDTVTGKEAAALYGHETTVRDSAWHPHLPLLVTASWDCSVGIWEHFRIDSDEAKDVTRPKKSHSYSFFRRRSLY